MGNEKRRFLLLLDDRPDIHGNSLPRLVIQGGKRFIQQQKFRISNERPDQGTALAHAAGELAWRHISNLPKAVALHQPLRRFNVGIVLLLLDLEAELYIGPNAPPGKQMIFLQHIADSGRDG